MNFNSKSINFKREDCKPLHRREQHKPACGEDKEDIVFYGVGYYGV